MWVISWRVNVTFSIATKLNQTAPYLYKWARVWATVIHYRKSVQWALLQFAEFLFIMDFLWIFVIFIKWSHRERHNKDQTEMEGREEWDWVLDKRIASMHVWKRFRWICSTYTHQLISMALRAIFRTKNLQLHAIDLNMSEWVSAPSALFPYFIKWVIRIYETTFFDNDYKFYMPKNHSRKTHCIDAYNSHETINLFLRLKHVDF